ncbi:acyl-CoA thioesterase [Nannocystaceae bacterium ST9]
MSAIHEHHHDVGADEIDELGHVGNVHYLAWLMRAATAHSGARGWPWERYRELGAAFVVRRHELDYLRSAMLGDRVLVRTWVATIARASSVRAYEVLRADQTLLRATTTWAFIDLRSGSPRRIPRELVEAFEVVPR